MTASTIGATVQFPGTERATTLMEQLARVLQGVGQAEQSVTSDTRQLGEATNQAAQHQGNFVQQATQFTQRVAGVANAVQSLTSQLGGQSRTAGLIGATANSIAQFAQLGAALGPEGAVVGGIVGALIPALHELIQSQDEAAQSARELQEQTRRLSELEMLRDAHRQQQVQSMVQGGHVETLTMEEVRQQMLLNDGAIVDATARMERLRQSQEHTTDPSRWHAIGEGIAEAQSQLQSYVQTSGLLAAQEARLQTSATQAASLTTATSGNARPRRGGGGGQTRDQRADEMLSAYRQQLDQLEQGPVSGIEDQLQQLEAAFSEAWGAAYDGASNYADTVQALDEQLRESQRAQLDAVRAHADAEEQASHQAEQLHDLKMKRIQDEARAQEDADRLRHRAVQQAMRDEDDRKRKLQQEAQQRQQEGQQATGAIISDLTNVFSIMAQGQMDAAHGAEMLLAAFLQYISQRATIEALAQVAQALGSYPDFGGMALHFAAAAGWAAVAIATGVGGAALASDAQSKGAAAQSQAQSQPSSPQPHSGNEKGGGNTYVINWNAPVVTAQTEAQLGRGVRRIVDRAAQRFPGG